MESFEIKKLDLDHTIYINLESLLKLRGKTVVGGGFDGKEAYPLDEIEFSKRVKSQKYMVLRATSGESHDLTVIIITTGSDFYKKDKLAGLLAKVSTNVMIVKPSKNKIKINSRATVEQVIDGDTYLITDWYAINNEKHRKVRVIKPSEWRDGVIHNNMYVEINELPAISHLAQEAVWYGAAVGDVVEIVSPSLSSNGYTTSAYRVVC